MVRRIIAALAVAALGIVPIVIGADGDTAPPAQVASLI
jgi:hypothetical protein